VTTPGDCPQEYLVIRTWTATDACGNSSSCSQSVEVQDTTAPDITCPTAKSPIECPGVPSFPDPIVSDACDPNPDVTFEDETTPGKCPQEFIVTRTWTATDACGNSQSCSQSVEVQDTTAPDITCADVKSPIECPATPVFPPPDVTDACDADPNVTFEDVTTPGKCPQEYIVTRTWTATDACGNSSSCTQSVEVQDTTDPTITCPAAIEVECGEEVPPPDTELVVCADSCDDSPSTEFVSDVSNGALCPDPEIITRTYRCTDACGNSAECTQTINVLCCPDDHFCTLTQGAYGSAGGTYNGQGTLALIQSLLSGSDLVIGKPGRSITIPQPAAQCIINRLPAGGISGSLPNIGDDTLAHPTCQTTPAITLNTQGNFANVLLGQTITLGLNLRLDPNLEDFELAKQFCTRRALPGPDGLFCTDDDVIDPNSPIQTFTILNAVINALSNLGLSNDVEGLFELANRALAAQATGGASPAQINAAVDAINRGFDGGRFVVPCPLGIVSAKAEDLEISSFGIQDAEAAPSVGPAYYELGQSQPNPFNPRTHITLSLPEATSWTLDIYNVSGQLVRRFEGQVDGAEYVPVVWDGTNRSGEPVAPGVYLYRMHAGSFSATRKMILLK
jgi:hypothetical protein